MNQIQATLASVIILLNLSGASAIGQSGNPQTTPAAAELAAQTPASESDSNRTESDVGKQTPALALKGFMVAMVSGDIQKLKKLSHPNDGVEILIPDQKPPETAMNQIMASFQALPVTRLKVGDTFKLPSGETVTFDESKINENRAILTFPNNPFPIPATRIKNAWKINPKSIIAVRKASMKLMKQRKEGQPAAPEETR